MYVTVQINEDLAQGSFVCHNADNVWRQAISTDIAPLGVTRNATFVGDDGVRWVEVILSGVCLARAGANIPAQGGWLGHDDEGRAVVISSEDCGLIAPLSRGQDVPALDDLILIHLR
jgi:serine/threonine protein kinase HipA of HipAB toxin-antitoxin module